ncbi:MAG: hypothetical protein QNJ05_11665 [Woeseiaceae bacterium]|nr:hypothetical protein [Woeseiaceae bacterium]
MNWDLLDFLVFGAMIAALVIIILVARRHSRNPAYRFAMVIAAIGGFLVAWINGAVGIIGSEENDANLLFFGILAMGAVGALLARLKAAGMVRVLVAMAAAQVLIAVFAIALDLGASSPVWPRGLVIMTTVFSGFWLSSAWLFSRAARRERRLFAD